MQQARGSRRACAAERRAEESPSRQGRVIAWKRYAGRCRDQVRIWFLGSQARRSRNGNATKVTLTGALGPIGPKGLPGETAFNFNRDVERFRASQSKLEDRLTKARQERHESAKRDVAWRWNQRLDVPLNPV